MASMFPELFWWIWSQALWILSALDLLDRFSAPITLYLVSIRVFEMSRVVEVGAIFVIVTLARRV